MYVCCSFVFSITPGSSNVNCLNNLASSEAILFQELDVLELNYREAQKQWVGILNLISLHCGFRQSEMKDTI